MKALTRLAKLGHVGAAALDAFDPSQERDEAGRWTASGAASATSKAEAFSSAIRGGSGGSHHYAAKLHSIAAQAHRALGNEKGAQQHSKAASFHRSTAAGGPAPFEGPRGPKPGDAGPPNGRGGGITNWNPGNMARVEKAASSSSQAISTPTSRSASTIVTKAMLLGANANSMGQNHPNAASAHKLAAEAHREAASATSGGASSWHSDQVYLHTQKANGDTGPAFRSGPMGIGFGTKRY